MNRKLAGLLAAAALLGASVSSVSAAPLAGSFNISGNMRLRNTSISFSDATAPGQASIGPGGTNSFVGTSGQEVDITSWSSTTEPVGTFSSLLFLSFPSDPTFPNLLINQVRAGVDGAAGCSATPPATGQQCTPTGSMFNFVNDGAPGALQSTLSFEFEGVTSDGLSTWFGTFTTQFGQPYQTVLAEMAGDGAVNTYAANITVTPGTTTTGVPEPLTLSLFGAGLAGAAALRRRRKISQV